jgi:hypothetical protein
MNRSRVKKTHDTAYFGASSKAAQCGQPSFRRRDEQSSSPCREDEPVVLTEEARAKRLREIADRVFDEDRELLRLLAQ